MIRSPGLYGFAECCRDGFAGSEVSSARAQRLGSKAQGLRLGLAVVKRFRAQNYPGGFSFIGDLPVGAIKNLL